MKKKLHPWDFDFVDIMREVIKHPKSEHQHMIERAFNWLKAPYNIHVEMYGLDPKWAFWNRDRTLTLLEGAYAYCTNVK